MERYHRYRVRTGNRIDSWNFSFGHHYHGRTDAWFNCAGSSTFLFLLSIPVIVLAGGVETMDYLAVASIDDLIIGALISADSAYLCIHYFLILLERIGMTPFVVYRLALGIVSLLLYA